MSKKERGTSPSTPPLRGGTHDRTCAKLAEALAAEKWENELTHTNYQGVRFGQFVAFVAEHYARRYDCSLYRSMTPEHDKYGSLLSFLHAAFNCNYDPEVAATQAHDDLATLIYERNNDQT